MSYLPFGMYNAFQRQIVAGAHAFRSEIKTDGKTYLTPGEVRKEIAALGKKSAGGGANRNAF